jgi:hypothetical protein
MSIVAEQGRIQIHVDDPRAEVAKQLCFENKLDVFSSMPEHWTIYVESKATAIAEVAAEVVEGPKKTRKPRAPKATKTVVEAPPDEAHTKIQMWEGEGRSILTQLAEIVIDDQITMDFIGELGRAAFEKRKEIDALRQHLKAPSLEAGRRVDNLCKPSIDLFRKIEDECHRLEAQARAAIKAAEAEALRKIEASGGIADAATLVVAHGINRLELASTSTEKVEWVWECTNFEEVPPEYKMVVLNQDLIDKSVQVHKTETKIPGIRVSQKITVGNKAVRR